MKLQPVNDFEPPFHLRWLYATELFGSEPFRKFAIDTNGFDPAAELFKSEVDTYLAPVACSRSGRYLGFAVAQLDTNVNLLTIGVGRN